jgi:uncharacterized membrane protein
VKLIFDGFKLAVCIRCFSFYLGGLFVSFLYLFKGKVPIWRISSYVLLAVPAILDFILEKGDLYTNIAGLRLLTGLLLGIAVFQLLLYSLSSDLTKNEQNLWLER